MTRRAAGRVEEVLAEQWRQLEEWYAQEGGAHLLRGPASPEAIAGVEQELGVTLPEELKRSLELHDGTEEDGWPGGTLLSCAGIVKETGIWRELLADGSFDKRSHHDPEDDEDLEDAERAVQPGWWNEGWICIDADGAGNGAVIDLAPGPGGTRGQLLDMDHEVGPSGPTAHGFIDYLDDVLEELDDCSVVDGSYVEG
ncbi:glucan synthase 1-like protein [Streptomyces triticagri]|uniref:Glucan synthase 1-like protein n=1 Tax=Streptomyces triticagri TaxID=2293568 RepID=A0A372M5Z3_9ACTN|nr:SMI1/KNR4 family protein [Streptomyces triticagri]RFU86354.1 glucan synthase 1-like protein [Streptomyces triticagri]